MLCSCWSVLCGRNSPPSQRFYEERGTVCLPDTMKAGPTGHAPVLHLGTIRLHFRCSSAATNAGQATINHYRRKPSAEIWHPLLPPTDYFTHSSRMVYFKRKWSPVPFPSGYPLFSEEIQNLSHGS